MDSQYKDIQAWKCKECGRVLQTEKGLIRHQLKCKYQTPVMEGQVSLFEQHSQQD